jgi:hypothetical protein
MSQRRGLREKRVSWNCPVCALKGQPTLLTDSGEELAIAGKVQYIYAIDMGGFVHESDRDSFEHIRGRASLARAMQAATVHAPESFELDADENQTVEDGYNFAAFRTRFKRGWLFNTFRPKPERLSPDRGELAELWKRYPADVGRELAELWKQYSFHVRLSRLGLVEVKLTRPVPGRDGVPGRGAMRLIDAMGLMMSTRISAPGANAESTLALTIAARFVAELMRLVVGEEGEEELLTIGMRPFTEFDPLNRDGRRIIERYTVLMLNHVQCRACGYRIEVKDLWEQHKSAIGAVLEGNLLEGAQRDADGQRKRTLPPIDDAGMQHLRDLGSWQVDLCLFSNERALIYYPSVRMMLNPFVANGETSISYERYWRCIVRIIEHTVSMRTALYILENQTTTSLSEVSDLTRGLIAEERLTRKDRAKIRRMAEQMAKHLSILPVLREALVPSANFRASYAAAKFDYLAEQVFRLSPTLEHIQRNIDEAFEFLQYFKTVQLQNDTEFETNWERFVGKVGLTITAVALFAIAPSFLTDLVGLLEDGRCAQLGPQPPSLVTWLCNNPLPNAVTLYFYIVFIGALAAGIIYFISPVSRRSREAERAGS